VSGFVLRSPGEPTLYLAGGSAGAASVRAAAPTGSTVQSGWPGIGGVVVP
jgi:hypothetical protein